MRTRCYAPLRGAGSGQRDRVHQVRPDGRESTCAWVSIRARLTRWCVTWSFCPTDLGKTVRVLVFAQGEAATRAQEAGADFIADDEMIAHIQGGWTDFDVAMATPDMMGKAGRLGRVLGPRGLMPNPKAGTVVPPEDLPRVIREAKAGRVEFRLDKTANLHIQFGKVSFPAEKLYENLSALMEAIKKARPTGAKGTYIRRITLTSTMGPGIKIDPLLAQTMEAKE